MLLRDDLFKETDSGLSLVASRCGNCGKVSFPKTDLCTYCLGRGMTEIELGRRCRLYSYTTTGATMEDIVYPSVKNHRHACLNPYAQYRTQLTAAEIINSRMISDPITLLQCCPFTDGAAAVVMCCEGVARKHTTRLVRMATSVLLSAPLEDPGEDIVGYKMLAEMAKMAYERADVSPEDIDLVELHDAFSSEEIWCYEDLMLCP